MKIFNYRTFSSFFHFLSFFPEAGENSQKKNRCETAKNPNSCRYDAFLTVAYNIWVERPELFEVYL